MRLFALSTLLALAATAGAQSVPKVPIGMNLHGNTYYSPPIFTDAMKSSGE